MKQLRINIKGERWTIHYLTRKAYQKRFGKDSLAITEYKHSRKDPQRDIFFSPRDRSLSTIVHELVHAYASYVYIDKPTVAKFEEKMCDVIGNEIGTIMVLAAQIKNFLRFS